MVLFILQFFVLLNSGFANDLAMEMDVAQFDANQGKSFIDKVKKISTQTFVESCPYFTSIFHSITQCNDLESCITAFEAFIKNQDASHTCQLSAPSVKPIQRERAVKTLEFLQEYKKLRDQILKDFTLRASGP